MRKQPLGVALFLVALGAFACKPAPVQTVEHWLAAHVVEDWPKLIQNSSQIDQPLLKRWVQKSQTSSLSEALPPKPKEYEIIEISKKEKGRRLVYVKLVLKNPLPYASEKVGHKLPENFPRTRNVRRNYLAVEEGGVWRVKNDLPRVEERIKGALKIDLLIDGGKLSQARALIDSLPEPPDDGRAVTDKDHLKLGLEKRLSVKAKTSTTS